jgi:hypothetical protein
MTAQTNQQKSQALRKRRKAEGLHEVRSLWAPKARHSEVKRLFKAWIKEMK